MILTLFFSILLGLILGGLTALVVMLIEEDDPGEYFEGFENPVATGFKRIFLGVFLITFGCFSFYDYSNQYEVNAQVKTSYEYSLENILILANSMNEKVAFKAVGRRLIVDVANMSQSSKTSNVYISYVNDVETYNKALTDITVRCDRSFRSILSYGFLPPVPEGIKFIKIKM